MVQEIRLVINHTCLPISFLRENCRRAAAERAVTGVTVLCTAHCDAHNCTEE